MKKVYFSVLIVLFSALAFAQGILNFVPKNVELVATFKNNSQNYASLKKVDVFSFLLNDLGIENLIQASVSQTAVSMGTKASQIWMATENDFVIFGKADLSSSEFDLAVALKNNSKTILNLLSSLVGGDVGSKTIDGTTFKTFSTKDFTAYALDHDGYVLLSNSPKLIEESVNSYEGKNPIFKFTQNVPNDAWFSIYTNADLTNNSTLTMIPKDTYAYGEIKNGSFTLTGISQFEYKDPALKSKVLSFKPNAKSLEENPATGDFWIAADVADPSELYKILNDYSKDFGLKEVGGISKEEAHELANRWNGKAFMNMSLFSTSSQYVAVAYLSKDISKYIPEISKNASATFTWEGHTVLRDDTIEGTITTSDYTIFYPDKVIFSDMAPSSAIDYLNSSSKAKEIGNYSDFSSQIWNNAFLIGYVDVGKMIEETLQYPLRSGGIFQMKIDNNANFIWQLILR